MTVEPQRREPRNVPSLLSRLQQERFTGAVDVEGGPGGTLFLRDGLVGAVETPAAPSARSLLLRSGRIDEQDWEAALVVVAEGGVLAETLTGRGLIAATELLVVCTAALFDGAFAMALQPVTGWRTDPGRAPELAAWPGQQPARLTEETARRLRTLREQFQSVGEFARTAVRPEARTDPGPLALRSRTLLVAANGRRTPRDLAFALGRGVYPVMLDLARLSARGFVARDVDPPAPRPLLTARTAERPAPPAPGAGDRPLPRRSPGSNLPPGSNLVPGRPVDSPPETSAEQRNTVNGLRLIRTALRAGLRADHASTAPEPPAAGPEAVTPTGVTTAAVTTAAVTTAVQATAVEPPAADPSAVTPPVAQQAVAQQAVAEQAVAGPPVVERPVAVSGTEPGRPEESAP